MPKAYLVAHIRIHDAEGYDRFRAMSGPAIAAHGGKILVRNPNPETREGTLQGVVIMIEFSDITSARTFYDSAEYAAARVVREIAAETDLLLVEGV